MKSLKAVAKQVLPPPLWNLARKVYFEYTALVHPSGEQRYHRLDQAFLREEVKRLYHAMNLRLVPNASVRGLTPYGEWCHQIGIFQTLMYIYLGGRKNVHIVDIGCGAGKFVPAAEPFIGESGRYIGIEVRRGVVELCRRLYPLDGVEFVHVTSRNPFYTPEVNQACTPYPLPDNSVDLVTALSIWTHLSEREAVFYFSEVNRMLRRGGGAILTFFVLDDTYYANLPQLQGVKSRDSAPNSFSSTHWLSALGQAYANHGKPWIFDNQFPGSTHWFYPSWVKVPEHAVGVTTEGIRAILLAGTDMEWVQSYDGFWKGGGGLFFQDILVFTKR